MPLRDTFRRAMDALTRPAKRRQGEAGVAVQQPSGGPPSSDLPDLNGITIAYAPEPGREPDPGEVVWTWVPYEDDPCQGKDRPVALFGRRQGDLVGVALTTKYDHPHQVLVGTGPWDREGRPSYAKLERILDVDPDRVRRVGGVLDKQRFDDLVFALRRFYA